MVPRSEARRRPRKTGQLSLPIRTWGGARRGAGRPPTGGRAGVSHLKRPPLDSHHPVHVTLRVADGLPKLRARPVYRRVERAIREGRERLGGRLVQFSVQGNHVHFIVEAANRRALSRFVQGLSVRLARAVNGERRGRVFADRFHARVLRTPREVKNALAYVLGNRQKHLAEGGVSLVGVLDECSSARWFDGWTIPDARERALGLARAGPGDPPVAEARTWLLRVGWRRAGRVDPNGVPGARRGARRRTLRGQS
ncbi:MAG TPA: transposase [Polyangiaceae bacterium]|nr:transposase [Polyangiaceae bacterium]